MLQESESTTQTVQFFGALLGIEKTKQKTKQHKTNRQKKSYCDYFDGCYDMILI